ncbi:hypothetical protein IPC545_26255, partial [Pseudomonas aeruginosa]
MVADRGRQPQPPGRHGPSAGDALLPPAQPRALSCRGSMINASFGAPWQRAAPLSVRAVPLRWQRLVLADARSGGLWGS